MKKTLTLICAAMLGAAGVLGVQAQTNTAIMLRSGTNGTSLVPTNAAGVISNALGLGPLATMTNTNTPLFVGTNGVVTETNAVAFPVLRTGEESVMLGNSASAFNGGGAVGNGAIAGGGGAVGDHAYTDEGGAVGRGASTHVDIIENGNGFAGGYNAKAEGPNRVQLGTGTNTNNGTMQFLSFPLVNASGKIPMERFPGWLTNTNTPLFVQGSNPAAVVSPWITIGTNVGALQIASNAISGPGSGISFVDNEIWGSFGFYNGIRFIGTNNAAAITRTNLGLGAGWLTNSNVPTPYSGAAVAGALLTADGAGGSAFSGTVPSISVIGDGDPWLIVTNNLPKMRTLVTFRGGSTANITIRVGSGFNDATGGNKVNGIEFYGDSGSSLGAIGYVSQRTFAIKAGTNAQTLRVYADETVNNNRFLEASMGSSGTAVIRPYGEGTNSNGNVLHISGLPTNNPGVGILWNSNGAVMVGY